jgi:hypothetical protein
MKIHAAPTPLLSPGPPITAVVPSDEIAIDWPNRPPDCPSALGETSSLAVTI